MFHTCDQRFDVTGNLKFFCELNKATDPMHAAYRRTCMQEFGHPKTKNFLKLPVTSCGTCMEH